MKYVLLLAMLIMCAGAVEATPTLDQSFGVVHSAQVPSSINVAHAFTTAGSEECILVVTEWSTDTTSYNINIPVSSVATTGLSWSLVNATFYQDASTGVYSYRQEVWAAYAPSAISGSTVVTFSSTSSNVNEEVFVSCASFTGTYGIDNSATGTFNFASGVGTGTNFSESVTTQSNNAYTLMVSSSYSSTARSAGTGYTLVDPTGTGLCYVIYAATTTPTSGTSVPISWHFTSGTTNVVYGGILTALSLTTTPTVVNAPPFCFPL